MHDVISERSCHGVLEAETRYCPYTPVNNKIMVIRRRDSDKTAFECSRDVEGCSDLRSRWAQREVAIANGVYHTIDTGKAWARYQLYGTTVRSMAEKDKRWREQLKTILDYPGPSRPSITIAMTRCHRQVRKTFRSGNIADKDRYEDAKMCLGKLQFTNCPYVFDSTIDTFMSRSGPK
jgi:hypothetical protein